MTPNLVKYVPFVGTGIRIAPLEALRLLELPQISLIEGLTLQLLPIDAECLEACSRVNNLCVKIGEGSCLVSYTPLAPGAPPAWIPELRANVKEGEEPLVEAPGVKRAEAKLDGVYAPRMLYLEPLAARFFRVEDAELEIWGGCLETPRGSIAFYAESGETIRADIKPGEVRIDGFTLRVRRCRRGVLPLLSRLVFSRVRAPVTIHGDVFILSVSGDSEYLNLILWNPHLHALDVSIRTRTRRIVEARACTAVGCEDLPVLRGSEAKLALDAHLAARLEIRLKRIPPLLKAA